MSARRPCRQCGKNRTPRFFVSERGRICLTCQTKTRRTSKRAGYVTRTYSLTTAQHAALLAHQSGVCAICGGARKYALNVDHDHATGKVRGLLCRRCNKLLAAARDDVELLVDAANYLRWPPMESIREVS